MYNSVEFNVSDENLAEYYLLPYNISSLFSYPYHFVVLIGKRISITEFSFANFNN